MSCRACTKVGKLYTCTQARVPNVLIQHLCYSDLRGKRKHNPNAKTTLRTIQVCLSALRNTSGGKLIIHISGQSCSDRFLGYFDEFLEESLNNLICDGQLFADAYERHWLWKLPNFKNYRDFIVISVTETKGVATVDFKTKICSDLKVERPSALNILSLLCDSVSPRVKAAEFRGIEPVPYESRHVQLKTFKPKEDDRKIIDNDPERFANYVWDKLRFREYLSCMTKIEDGGSYYLGITEKKNTFTTHGEVKYESLVPHIEGFELQFDVDELERQLIRVITSGATIYFANSCFMDIPKELVKFKFYNVARDKYVLEIAVGSLAGGIVFFDKQGPEAYQIVSTGNVERLTKEDWLLRMRSTLNDICMSINID
ncbi:uncharacterized protein [Haliotis cracherodii]|uniref:uncharacterized protein n=1 Tax=Haliotis cracherodii TaxID=6455 RepID=UPI0039E8651E